MGIELYDPRRSYQAAAGAKLTFRGGPLLTSVKLVGVFVDDFPYKAEMSAYLDWLATSDVLGELSEYNTGLGEHTGDAQLSLGGSTPPPPPPPVPGPPPPPKPHRCPPGCQAIKHRHHKRGGVDGVGLQQNLTLLREKGLAASGTKVVQDADLQKLLEVSLRGGLLPPADDQTVYVMFLPDGVTVDLGSDASCQTFCGYHDSFSYSGGRVFYAVLPYPSCSGCTGGKAPFDALTGTTSHEVCEAITDPIPGMGWYDDANGEVGDICAWQFRQDGKYSVQLEWSNQHNACV